MLFALYLKKNACDKLHMSVLTIQNFMLNAYVMLFRNGFPYVETKL